MSQNKRVKFGDKTSPTTHDNSDTDTGDTETASESEFMDIDIEIIDKDVEDNIHPIEGDHGLIDDMNVISDQSS